MDKTYTNPFRRMVEEEGTLQNLMIKLYPMTYTGVYSYIQGSNKEISRRTKKILSQFYSEDEIKEMDRQYRLWREYRSMRAN